MTVVTVDVAHVVIDATEAEDVRAVAIAFVRRRTPKVTEASREVER